LSPQGVPQTYYSASKLYPIPVHSDTHYSNS